MNNMSFFIRLTPEEKSLAESYAKIHSISVEDAFKRALFERIEEECDIAVARDAYDEYAKDGRTSKPIFELWKDLDLCVMA